MAFDKEADFEQALIQVLTQTSWENTVLKNVTEQELLENWANILFENNRGILCMRPELSAINADNFIVPIWSI